MNQSDINKSRRRFLIGATSTIGVVGVTGVAMPFIASWNPNAKAKAVGSPVKVDISKLENGQQIIVAWRGQPVWVVRRSRAAISNLSRIVDQLRDPNSETNQQPDYARNEYRSIKPEIAVLVGICTHLGCSPTYRPDVAPQDLGKDWLGGYLCPCHGSRFDLAGRVYKGVPAPSNLVVPPYTYLSENIILVGADEDREK